MRIPCPHCGERDAAEFTYLGAAGLERPDGLEAGVAAMTEYVYLRDNPAGPLSEHWYHAFGCRAWLTVTRDTRTHAITGAVPARNRAAAERAA